MLDIYLKRISNPNCSKTILFATLQLVYNLWPAFLNLHVLSIQLLFIGQMMGGGCTDMEVTFKKYDVDTIFEVFPPLGVKPPLMAASRLVSPAYQGGSSTSPPYLRSPCSRWAQSCYSGFLNSVPIFKIFKTNWMKVLR